MARVALEAEDQDVVTTEMLKYANIGLCYHLMQPETPSNGSVYFDDNLNVAMVYVNNRWEVLATCLV